MQVNLYNRHGVVGQSLGYNAAQYSQQKKLPSDIPMDQSLVVQLETEK